MLLLFRTTAYSWMVMFFLRRKTTWCSGWHPCPWQGGWNQVISKVHSNPTHSMKTKLRLSVEFWNFFNFSVVHFQHSLSCRFVCLFKIPFINQQSLKQIWASCISVSLFRSSAETEYKIFRAYCSRVMGIGQQLQMNVMLDFMYGYA